MVILLLGNLADLVGEIKRFFKLRNLNLRISFSSPELSSSSHSGIRVCSSSAFARSMGGSSPRQGTQRSSCKSFTIVTPLSPELL